MSNWLIICADDYGMCNSVNQAIEECLEAGSVKATCVMTNMPCYTGLETLRKNFPQTSIGLHWTLTIGEPVLPTKRVSSLVDECGKFFSFLDLRRRLLTHQIKFVEIRDELIAQYERFHALGGKPDFWNTHENVQLWPGLFNLFVRVGQDLGFRVMRSHRRVTVPYRMSATRYNFFHPLYWLKGQVIALWSYKAERIGMLMPAGIIDTPGFLKGKVEIEKILTFLKWSSRRREIEMIIHPAKSIHRDLFGNLADARLSEYAVFRDTSLKKKLCQAGIEVVGFEVLRHGCK